MLQVPTVCPETQTETVSSPKAAGDREGRAEQCERMKEKSPGRKRRESDERRTVWRKKERDRRRMETVQWATPGGMKEIDGHLPRPSLSPCLLWIFHHLSPFFPTFNHPSPPPFPTHLPSFPRLSNPFVTDSNSYTQSTSTITSGHPIHQTCSLTVLTHNPMVYVGKHCSH